MKQKEHIAITALKVLGHIIVGFILTPIIITKAVIDIIKAFK